MLSQSLIDNQKVFYRFYIAPSIMENDRHELLVRLLHEENVEIEYKIPSKVIKNVLGVVICNEEDVAHYDYLPNKLIVTPKKAATINHLYSAIDINSINEIDDLIANLKELKIIKTLEQKIEQSDVEIQKAIKTKKTNEEKSNLKYFEKCLDLEVSLLKDKSHLSWNEKFSDFVKDSKYFSKVMIGLRSEFISLYKSNKLSFNQNEHFISIYDDQTVLFLETKEDAYNHYESFELLMNVIIRTLANADNSLIKNEGEIDVWKKIFSKLPYPMAIISSLGDLLIHNESFAQLEILPKECLNYEDQKNFEIGNQYFQLRKIPFSVEGMDVFYFVFYSSSNNSNANSQINLEEGIDELGIISSSIAHELNNPLAGILAALSLLALEDDWSQESINDINEMRSGAKRCKELVEIFLGFSRFSTNAQKSLPIQNSLNQAINLLRFRMIESNFRLDIKFVESFEKMNHQMNSSVLSMIFYLIFSELMTAFSHHKLVANNDNPVISGQVMEFSNQICIKLDNDFDFQNKIIQSKLITHLLKFEKIEMHTKSNEIKLIHKA